MTAITAESPPAAASDVWSSDAGASDVASDVGSPGDGAPSVGSSDAGPPGAGSPNAGPSDAGSRRARVPGPQSPSAGKANNQDPRIDGSDTGRERPRLRGSVRSGALRLGTAAIGRLSERLAVPLADASGELWYRMAPRRAEQGRLNLQRVCTWLVANDMANDRVRRAAGDARALERLLRAAFRQTARYYLEVARASNIVPTMLMDRLVIETPNVAEAAVDGGATILVGLHFGVVELPAAYFALRADKPVTIPMETLDDPALQAWFERSRGVAGVRIVGLGEARRELGAALRRGELVGLVADRDITGGGIPVDFFGARASLPVGPGLLAIETGARVFVASVRRAERGRYRCRLEVVPVPPDGTRRERLTAFLIAEAAAFERAISFAPEQWWAVFQPIWPDLVAGHSSNSPGSKGALRSRTAVPYGPDPEQPE